MLAALGSLSVALSTREELRQALLDAANRAHGFNPDLQVEQFVSYMMTPAGVTTMAVSLGVLFAVLSGLGGLISASTSRRKPPR